MYVYRAVKTAQKRTRAINRFTHIGFRFKPLLYHLPGAISFVLLPATVSAALGISGTILSRPPCRWAANLSILLSSSPRGVHLRWGGFFPPPCAHDLAPTPILAWLAMQGTRLGTWVPDVSHYSRGTFPSLSTYGSPSTEVPGRKWESRCAVSASRSSRQSIGNKTARAPTREAPSIHHLTTFSLRISASFCWGRGHVGVWSAPVCRCSHAGGEKISVSLPPATSLQTSPRPSCSNLRSVLLAMLVSAAFASSWISRDRACPCQDPAPGSAPRREGFREG